MSCADEFRIKAVVAEFVLSPGCPEPPACVDGEDNDLDGAADFPTDPGCESFGDEDERGGANPCDDGLDNDGDGLLDFSFFDTFFGPITPEGADIGCDSLLDDSERGPASLCDNGINEDEEDPADFPDDPGCTSPTDASELGGLCVDDEFEENDRLGPVFGFLPSQTPPSLTLGDELALTLCPHDSDTFAFGTGTSDTFDVTFDYVDADGSLILEIYSQSTCGIIPITPCWVVSATVTSPTGVTPVSFLFDAGDYRLRVIGDPEGTTNTYALGIAVSG